MVHFGDFYLFGRLFLVLIWVLKLNLVLTFWFLALKDNFKFCEWEVLETDGKIIDGLLGLYARSYGLLQQQIHNGFLWTT